MGNYLLSADGTEQKAPKNSQEGETSQAIIKCKPKSGS